MADNSKKSNGFLNSYGTNNLAFSKEVRGNQGSKDKYFKFTVQLTNADSLNVNDNDTFIGIAVSYIYIKRQKERSE